MIKLVETQIEEYEKGLREGAINVINVDAMSPEHLMETFRPLIEIPNYGINRRPLVESELDPLMVHYANLHAQAGELLGIVANRVRYYSILGQKEHGSTARTKREILDELRRDIRMKWDTVKSMQYSQSQNLKPLI